MAARNPSLDLETGGVQTLPGSDGLQTARWSPDGRFVAALQPEPHELALFDWRTEVWQVLAEGIDGNDLSWAHDSRFVYASVLGNDLADLHPGNRSQIADAWFAVIPDREFAPRQWQHGSEIYAYSVDLR